MASMLFDAPFTPKVGKSAPLPPATAQTPLSGNVAAGGYSGIAGAPQSGYAAFVPPDPTTFAQDPSYGFRLSEGAKGIERSAARRGTLLTGGTAKALTDWGQNAASQEYQNAYERALSAYDTNRSTFAMNRENAPKPSLASMGGGWSGPSTPLVDDHWSVAQPGAMPPMPVANYDRNPQPGSGTVGSQMLAPQEQPNGSALPVTGPDAYQRQMDDYARQQDAVKSQQAYLLQQQGLTAEQARQVAAEQARIEAGNARVNAPRPGYAYLPYDQPTRGAARA